MFFFLRSCSDKYNIIANDVCIYIFVNTLLLTYILHVSSVVMIILLFKLIISIKINIYREKTNYPADKCVTNEMDFNRLEHDQLDRVASRDPRCKLANQLQVHLCICSKTCVCVCLAPLTCGSQR